MGLLAATLRPLSSLAFAGPLISVFRPVSLFFSINFCILSRSRPRPYPRPCPRPTIDVKILHLNTRRPYLSALSRSDSLRDVSDNLTRPQPFTTRPVFTRRARAVIPKATSVLLTVAARPGLLSRTTPVDIANPSFSCHLAFLFFPFHLPIARKAKPDND